MTPSRQRNAVSEGFALGLVLCGYSIIDFDKVRVDLAFEDAWRSWSHKGVFRQVNRDLENGLDAYIVFSRAERGHKTWVFYWESDGISLNVVRRDPQWDSESQEDVAYAVGMISDDIDRAGWVELARSFLEAFSR